MKNPPLDDRLKPGDMICPTCNGTGNGIETWSGATYACGRCKGTGVIRAMLPAQPSKEAR